MSIEERIELHEQWLRSMESNHSQISADLAAVTRNQAVFAENQALLAATMVAIAEEWRKLEEAHRRLEETVDRYIRFRGNGQQQN